MPKADTTVALTTIIEALKPLKSDERRQTVGAAMTFLGETAMPAAGEQSTGAGAGSQGAVGGGSHPGQMERWMKQYGVSNDELDQVFHFNADGSFAIHDAPGNSKKEKTLNTYVLTGLGKYLATNERTFDDATARAFCETIGCLDTANHAYTLKHSGADFTGDKKKGYTLTNVGVKRGAALVKELAGAAK